MERDAKILQVYEGTNQIQRNVIGQELNKEVRAEEVETGSVEGREFAGRYRAGSLADGPDQSARGGLQERGWHGVAEALVTVEGPKRRRPWLSGGGKTIVFLLMRSWA